MIGAKGSLGKLTVQSTLTSRRLRLKLACEPAACGPRVYSLALLIKLKWLALAGLIMLPRSSKIRELFQPFAMSPMRP